MTFILVTHFNTTKIAGFNFMENTTLVVNLYYKQGILVPPIPFKTQTGEFNTQKSDFTILENEARSKNRNFVKKERDRSYHPKNNCAYEFSTLTPHARTFSQ